jgi:DNA-binding beta-propeller fold protein YncE
MKIIIAYILTCISVVAAGTNDIQVFTTLNTNTQPGILITIGEFTRDGQTNLVCDTRTKDGVLRIRTHRFYHDGLLVGEYSTNNLYAYNRSSFISVAGAPYGISFNLDSSNKMSAFVTDTNHLILESYSCTNGIFYSADSSFIAKLNGMMKDKLPH